MVSIILSSNVHPLPPDFALPSAIFLALIGRGLRMLVPRLGLLPSVSGAATTSIGGTEAGESTTAVGGGRKGRKGVVGSSGEDRKGNGSEGEGIEKTASEKTKKMKKTVRLVTVLYKVPLPEYEPTRTEWIHVSDVLRYPIFLYELERGEEGGGKEKGGDGSGC